jgi:sulfate transport system permease protein
MVKRSSQEATAMSEASVIQSTVYAPTQSHVATTEPVVVRWTLTVLAVGFLSLFLVVPLVAIFYQAMERGIQVYFAAMVTPDSLSAIRLTMLTAAIVVPLNTVFGIAAAWAISKFEFLGKRFLITLIDLPYSVSPVIAGLVFFLVFGRNGWFGPWLDAHGMQVIFNTPGVILATLFVTFPFVARELIPLMEAQGTEEEEAAQVLGASGLQTFWRITLPNIKWGLLYGVVLCNGRAMGEFGAVSVVSGRLRGLTTTMPLHVENLYNESDQLSAAFAVASLLAMLALVTLVLKTLLEWKVAKQLAQTTAVPHEESLQ